MEKRMSDLYIKALNTQVEIKMYLEEVNSKAMSLYSKVIALTPRSNDRAYAEELNKVKSELARVRADIQAVGLLDGQIDEITTKFFREYHSLVNTQNAEASYLEFLHSTLYKSVMGGPRKDFKIA